MQKVYRWVYLFLMLALPGCGEKPQNDRQAAGSAPPNLSSDISKLAEQFEADSAGTRLVLLLSPT